jgi:hypothetical protein
MESPRKVRCQQLIRMMDAFVAGEDRSRDFVGRMEGELVACGLDDDEGFSDLQMGLALFGAGERDADENMLLWECRYALRLLREEQ